MVNTIWLIDDDESIRESMIFLLSGMGWEVKAFESIEAFVTAKGESTGIVGCLLLDMRMPGKGGLTWLEEGEMAVANASRHHHDRARYRRRLPPGIS